ncbi:Glucosyl-3-phosphoglycerate phosphatase [Corynebacterium occultum]|uniref:Glucosyl-3-phosphoglycerate phosphatase n=1 Tax=Corynebacterium occultum TaxID=2675219 RepID=A0A6B8WB12_9CORY|nr:histidine phosphatase family protein [Corynebacterium occultum]QGU08026.1 Glucosyl-3-phosphoglycerate phosphatase [Corynebacterium occultum]
MTRRLILLRHGQTEYNATRRMQGQLDTDLSDIGRAQAQRAAELLRSEGISRIISSDLTRAFDTATVVAEFLGIGVSTDRRLRETDLGQWQGRSHAEVDTELPGARALWRHDATWAPPGGESRVQVARRARPVIEELMSDFQQWDDSAVLVVAHGGTISALTSSLLGLEVSQYPMFSGLGNTNSSRLSARPRFLPGSNDADGESEPDPLSARFHSGNVNDAQWYLDGWNVGA